MLLLWKLLSLVLAVRKILYFILFDFFKWNTRTIEHVNIFCVFIRMNFSCCSKCAVICCHTEPLSRIYVTLSDTSDPYLGYWYDARSDEIELQLIYFFVVPSFLFVFAIPYKLRIWKVCASFRIVIHEHDKSYAGRLDILTIIYFCI